MAIIEGQVTDSEGNSVAGAALHFVSAPVAMPDIALLTDDAGRFSLGVPVDGTYVLGIQAPQTSARVEIKVASGRADPLKVRLPPPT